VAAAKHLKGCARYLVLLQEFERNHLFSFFFFAQLLFDEEEI